LATRILRQARLAAAVLAPVLGGATPPAPSLADAEVLGPEHWTYRLAAPGVVEVGVPLVPPSFDAAARVPDRLEILFFDTELPADLPLDALAGHTPVARAEASPGSKPGVVPFEVAGLAPEADYSAVVLGHFDEA
jgi:hypothetical protein